MKLFYLIAAGVVASRFFAAAATAEYVIQVSSDGLAATFLRSYVSNAVSFPTFSKLVREGASTFNARCDYEISETVPNHATMLTARPTSQTAGLSNTVHHGWTSNFPATGQTFHNANPNLGYVPSVFDVAHDHGLRTALYVSKTRLQICETSWNVTNGAPDVIGVDNGRDKIDLQLVNNGPISSVVDRLVTDLNSTNPPNYSFIHLTEPDTAGHSSGWGSVAWSNAVRQVDLQIGRILAVVSTNSRFAGKTVVIVTADHGGGGSTSTGHTDEIHPQNYTIPFFVWGNSVPAGVNAYSLFSNRFDPGTNRVTYTAAQQPIRNGDGSNLALGMLGLPTIPGSFMIPHWGPLSVSADGQNLTISWPATGEQYVLESADPALPQLEWEAITTQPEQANNIFTIVLPTTEQARIFRLRR